MNIGYRYQSLYMYPREITTTRFWIRHALPLGPPSPPNGDEALRQQIRSRNVISTDEMIEEYVRHERARLDLKWCLDQFFAWPLPNPFVGQLVVTNISGFVHLAYIIDCTPAAVSITPVDKFGDFIMIGYDDIYDATYSPFMDNYLVNHHLLHPQQVLNYIANQDRKHALLQSSHNDPDDNNHPHVTNIATQTEPCFGLDPSVSSTINMVTTRSRAQTISHTDTTVPSITIPDELIPSSSSCISTISPRVVTDPRITFDGDLTELQTAQRLDPDIQHIIDFRSSQEKQLCTFSRTHATEISWHVLKSSIRRSYSKYISPSKASCCFRSPVSFYGRRYYQFLQSITTHLISWWLVLFTILLGTETAHIYMMISTALKLGP